MDCDMCLKLFSIVYSIQSVCNGLICLSWKLQKSTLMFKCITSQVRAQISFFDQYNQEQGFCTIPFPFSQCINFYQNGSFRQNLLSKETAYDVRGKLGIHMNGYWTCHYGKNKEAAVTYVNIFNRTGDFRLPAFILLTGPSKVKPDDSFWLSCFSNVLLSIKAVRFYIDNRMYAVLTNDIYGCHELVTNRVCTPDTCNCSVDGRTHAVIHEGFKSSGLFVVECRVEFEESFVMSDCFILDVLDIEGLRIIQDKEMPFLESDQIKLTCVVNVKQMHTKLEWECFNMEPDEEFQNSTFMKSSISFTVRSIMNDRICFCRLKHNGYETSTKLKFKITQPSTNEEFNLHYTVWIFSGIIVGIIILVLICVYKTIRVGMRGSVNVRAVYQAAAPTHAQDNTYDIPEELTQNEEMNAIQNIDLATSSDNEYEEIDKEVSNGTEGGYQIPHDYMEVF